MFLGFSGSLSSHFTTSSVADASGADTPSSFLCSISSSSSSFSAPRTLILYPSVCDNVRLIFAEARDALEAVLCKSIVFRACCWVVGAAMGEKAVPSRSSVDRDDVDDDEEWRFAVCLSSIVRWRCLYPVLFPRQQRVNSIS